MFFGSQFAISTYCSRNLGIHVSKTQSQTYKSQDQVLPTSKAAWLRAKQIELLFDKLYVSMIAVVFTASVVVFALWLDEPNQIYIIWLAVVVLISLYRSVLTYLYYRRPRAEKYNPEKWLSRFTFGSLLTGLSLGLGSFLLCTYASMNLTLAIALIICCLAFGSVLADSAVFSTCFAFISSLVLPVVYSLFIKGEPLTLILGVLGIIFYGCMLLYSLRLNKNIVNTLELQFDNAELVSSLSYEKQIVETRVKERTKELTLSENKFASVFRASPDIITILRKKDGKIIDINIYSEKVTGYKCEELLGKSLFELEIWCDPNDRFKLLKALRRGGVIHNMQFDLVSNFGDIRHCEISADSVTINDEQCLVTITRDVSERSRTIEALKESEEQFKSAFSHAPLGLVLVHKDGVIFHSNPMCLKIIGYSPEEINGMSIRDLTHPDDLEVSLKKFSQFMSGEIGNYQLEKRYKHKQGHYVWNRLSISAVRNVDGEILYAIAHVEDIAERKKMEIALIKSEEQFRNVFEYAPIGICLVDKKGTLIRANTAACEMVGYSMDEFKDINFIDLVHPDEKEVSMENHRKLFSGELENCSLKRRYLHKKGHYIWGNLNISVVHDHNDKPSYLIAQAKDITETLILNEQLSFQASHDSLTQLINRREFENRLKRILESSHLDTTEHVLCYLDLDQFKIINDTCGHTVGDEMLCQLSRLLESRIRKRDTLARLGGDEFGILMEHCSVDNAKRAANSLREVIQQFQFLWEEQVFNIGASFGLVPITKDSSMADHLKAADTACYAAKDLGRNRVYVYNEDDVEQTRRQGEMMWVNRINLALKENRFFLVAQPIQSVHNIDKSGRKLEILLRMEDSSGEIISPAIFLPAAERYGLVSTLDRKVIKTAIQAIDQDRTLSSNLSMCSINLSGKSIGDKDFLEFVELIFDRYPGTTEKICFEITETAAINNFANALHFITTLRKRGCFFALDDFGSGLSSFGYLKNLPVDFIKIDGMFIKDIEDNETNYAMVKSINEIAHVMEKQTIAEFVENNNILEKLNNIGVDYVQGYAIGKPHPFSRKVKLRVVS